MDNMSMNLGERVLLLFFSITSIYMFAGSFEFRDVAALFPRITSVIVIVGAMLLFTRNHLPQSIRKHLVDPKKTEREIPLTAENAEEGASSQDTMATDTNQEEVQMTDVFGKEVPVAGLNRVVTTVLLAGYIVLSYLIGMLWATPIFVLGYAVYVRLPWYFIVSLPIIGYAIVSLFMSVVYLPVNSGALHELGWI